MIAETYIYVIEFAIIGAIFIAALISRRRENRKFKEILHSIAMRRGGRMSNSTTGSLTLYMDYKGKHVSVSFIGEGTILSPRFATVSISVDIPRDFKMHIFRKGKVLYINLRKFDMRKIEIESDYFDSKFTIIGNNPDFIRDLLDHRIQEAILNIENLSPIISIMHGNLTVKVNAILTDEEEIDRLIDVATAIFDRMEEIESG